MTKKKSLRNKKFEDKNKKDLRVEIIKALEGKRKFNLYWTDTTNMSIEIEAKDEEEARKRFYDGQIDWDNVSEGDTEYMDDSLEIEEVEE